jgi:hypothetical protein
MRAFKNGLEPSFDSSCRIQGLKIRARLEWERVRPRSTGNQWSAANLPYTAYWNHARRPTIRHLPDNTRVTVLHHSRNIHKRHFIISLLKLPAELRNRIYEYALTAPPPSTLAYSELPTSQEQKPQLVFTLYGEPFNTLKNTCRQLRAETSGLELAFNTLNLRHKNLLHEDQLQHFCARATDAEYTHLSTLLSSDSDTEDSDSDNSTTTLSSLDLVAQWCHAYPNVTVKYLLDNVRFSKRGWPANHEFSTTQAANCIRMCMMITDLFRVTPALEELWLRSDFDPQATAPHADRKAWLQHWECKEWRRQI